MWGTNDKKVNMNTSCWVSVGFVKKKREKKTITKIYTFQGPKYHQILQSTSEMKFAALYREMFSDADTTAIRLAPFALYATCSLMSYLA